MRRARPIYAAIERFDRAGGRAATRIDAAGRAELWAAHFADAELGFAGGEYVLDDGTRMPLILHSDDSGTSWAQGKIADGFPGSRVAAVLRGDSENGWAAVNKIGSAGATLLKTSDGGVTWAPVPSPVGTIARLRGFVQTARH
jgi:photosystem II stability/assembly factor-like uncharacterized protein